ncbi:hypothetical protein KKC06_00775 [Patescibacteria group bacterium]|nr:hypothetical protein [Patescibacteria group bacterium]
MSDPKIVVLGDAVSTGIVPVGRFFKNLRAAKLGGLALKELMKRTGLTQDDVYMVIVATVVPDCQGLDRAVLAEAGWDLTKTKSKVVNTVCCSALQAYEDAKDTLQAREDAKCIIIVGTESMTNTHMVPNPDQGLYGKKELIPLSDIIGLTSFNGGLMWQKAEAHRKTHGYTRADMDAVATRSFGNAYRYRAEISSRFIFPVEGVIKVDGDPGFEPFTVDHDYPRLNKDWSELEVTPELITGWKSYLGEGGDPTIVNVSSKNDAAMAQAVMLKDFADSRGLKVMAKLIATESAYTEPDELFDAPVKVVEFLLKKQKLTTSDIADWQGTEAFGNQAHDFTTRMNIDPAIVNRYGGAIALGHAIGMSGGRRAEEGCYFLEQSSEQFSIVFACGGGGRATGLILEQAT